MCVCVREREGWEMTDLAGIVMGVVEWMLEVLDDG